MREKKRRSKNAGRICEKHRIIDTKNQIRTKKKRTKNDEGNRNSDNNTDYGYKVEYQS
jgi:hypothetical protein